MHLDGIVFLGLAGAVDLVGCFDTELCGGREGGEGEEEGGEELHFDRIGLDWLKMAVCFETDWSCGG